MIFAPLAVEFPASLMHMLEMALSNGLAGSSQFWLFPFSGLQVQMSSCVPFLVLKPGSSRHLPETGLYSAPYWPAIAHSSLAPPLQLHSWILDPLAVPLLTM